MIKMMWQTGTPPSLPHRLVPVRFKIGIGIICFYYIDDCEILRFPSEIKTGTFVFHSVK